MAIKASASVTLSLERDISSVTRFYKIAPSTNTPTKPSGTADPSGWSTVEPAYDGTSTNSLYITDRTIFTDNTASWSPVSKSSSYEASKQAYNEAYAASQSVTELNQNMNEAIAGLLDDVDSSQETANGANQSYSELEKVIGAFSWISQHGTYSENPTEDTTVVPGKYYFQKIGNKYEYVVPADDANPSSFGYYELVSADATLADYLASHVSLTVDNGLEIQTDGVESKLQLTSDGVHLINDKGFIIATFSETITLGDTDGLHVKLSGGGDGEGPELAFMDGSNKVAYVNSSTLYIEQAELTNQLRIGQFVWTTQGADRISLVYDPL